MGGFEKEDPRYHSDSDEMIGAKTAEELEDFSVGDRVWSIIPGRYGKRKATVVEVGIYCIDIKIDYNGAVVPYDRKEIALIAE